MDSTERSSVRKILCKAWPFMSLREMEEQPPFGVRVRISPERSRRSAVAAERDAALSADEALAAINALRCNAVATQSAGWSNLMYPLVAILNAAGFSYAAPTDEQTAEHLNAYGGAGGWPGKGQTA